MTKKSLDRLVKGFEKFRIESYELQPQRMQGLIKNGQHPEALVIACSDSRSCPENLFGTEPGDIFVARHIAALVPPYDPTDENDTVSASIEFAVTQLKVKSIVVVGHTHCGGIEGLAKDVKDGAVGHWIQRAAEIKERVENKSNTPLSADKLAKEMERESIIWSLKNLRTYPCVQQALQEGRLQIHGWQFGMEEGELLEYNIQTRQFEVIAGHGDNQPPPESSDGDDGEQDRQGPKAV